MEWSIVQNIEWFLLGKVNKCNIGLKTKLLQVVCFQLIIVAYNDDVGPTGHLSLEGIWQKSVRDINRLGLNVQ